MKGKFTLPLLAILGALLLGVWIADRRGPTYPDGEFWPLVLWTAIVVGVAWLIVTTIRGLRK